MAMTQEFTEQPQSSDGGSLWLPPEERPARRQVIGSPYVWDGQGQPPDGEPEPVPGRQSMPTVESQLVRARMDARAVIGNQLRKLAAWCELDPCIGRYTDATALGEADIIDRAIAAGWCKDAFGRLICPACQQCRPIWSAAPLVRRDEAHTPPSRERN